ncbi:hypothetical protein TU86_15925 [Pseudomonas weihenstephanensis]|uniref:Uncharacterized protein n=1 Tax=Pseudomonas weihenstephanensis TaxID=1608994 RepID=A0A0J6IED0_9PSED|nr:hypothetical protein TU86_15925 [Pseudomonas weihenstephanensis]
MAKYNERGTRLEQVAHMFKQTVGVIAVNNFCIQKAQDQHITQACELRQASVHVFEDQRRKPVARVLDHGCRLIGAYAVRFGKGLG